ncbi:MAG: toll/interleukin-1 receptor domain-containing protein [Endomicrobiales bacterium]
MVNLGKSIRYIENIIENAISNCSFDYYEDKEKESFVFRALIEEKTYSVRFSRLLIEGFENSFDDETTEQHIRGKSAIQYNIFCTLGKEGIFRPDFRISKKIFEEIGIWKSISENKDISLSPSFTENIIYGLNKLKDYLDHKHQSTRSNIFKGDVEKIERIIKHANKHNGSLDGSRVPYDSLGFLKAAALLKIIDIEQSKEKETSKRMQKEYDVQIYELVSEMHKHFMDVKLPDCASEYYADLDKPNSSVTALTSGKNPPLIFISYVTEEIELADFIKEVIQYSAKARAKVFIAKRDIPSGENPRKTMLLNNLKAADAIIPICSHLSKNSSWLWWETASAWGRDKRVYPLFTNISAKLFGEPLILECQGKDYFNDTELKETLTKIYSDLGITAGSDILTQEHRIELSALKTKFSKIHFRIKVDLSFEKISEESNGDIHRYWLNYDVTNTGKE